MTLLGAVNKTGILLFFLLLSASFTWKMVLSGDSSAMGFILGGAVAHQLSLALRAVVAQRLLPGLNHGARVPAVEILQVTKAVAHLVRVGKWEQIYSAIETGRTEGMRSFEQSLRELVENRLIAKEEAYRATRDPGLLEELLNSGRSVT